MKTLIALAAAVTAVASGPAFAQSAAHEVKAREIYARVISFRTAAGQRQTPAMVAYLVDVLKAGGYIWSRHGLSSADTLYNASDEAIARVSWETRLRIVRHLSHKRLRHRPTAAAYATVYRLSAPVSGEGEQR